MFSRREVKEDIKEGFGEDIEMFFSASGKRTRGCKEFEF